MHSHLRNPDCLDIAVIRGVSRAETALTITHAENGLEVVVFDSWSPVPDRGVGDLVGRAVGLWITHGPLASMAYMRAHGRPGAR